MDSKYSGYYVVWGLFVLFGDFIRAVFFLTFSLKTEKCVFLMAVRARTHKSKPVLLSQHTFKQQSGFWTMSFSFNAWGEESLGTGGTDTYMNLQGCAKRDYFFDKRRCFWSKYFFECRLQQAHYKHIIGGGRSAFHLQQAHSRLFPLWMCGTLEGFHFTSLQPSVSQAAARRAGILSKHSRLSPAPCSWSISFVSFDN